MGLLEWLIVAGLFAILEILTTGFLLIWVALAALITGAITTVFNLQIQMQILAFTILSTVLLLFTRKLADRVKPSKQMKTSYEKVIGKTGVIIEEYDEITGKGIVKVNGDTWSLIADESLEKGTKVKVIALKGVKLQVERIEK